VGWPLTAILRHVAVSNGCGLGKLCTSPDQSAVGARTAGDHPFFVSIVCRVSLVILSANNAGQLVEYFSLLLGRVSFVVEVDQAFNDIDFQ
jgi:hypothetical protein